MATTANEQTALDFLVSAFYRLAPTNEDKVLFKKTLDNMNKEGEKIHNQCKTATSMIYDGLAYGNWPANNKKL
jgi:hypothetical protein